MPQTLSCIILYSEDFHPDDQKAAKKAGIMVGMKSSLKLHP